MDTYILLRDRPASPRPARRSDLRLMLGLIGTAAALILSLSGPRIAPTFPASHPVATSAGAQA